MIHKDPDMRPSAVNIIQHRVLCPFGNKTKAQLRRELNAEKLKNEFLSRQLKEAAMCLQTMAPAIMINKDKKTNKGLNTRLLRSTVKTLANSNNSNDRVIGKKVNRSHSTSNF